MTTEQVYKVRLRRPHPEQQKFIYSPAKRKIIRAGRRGGKTVGIAIKAVQEFLKGHRVLYGAPTVEQVDRFWFEVNRALTEPVLAGKLRKNEGEHFIEVAGTENRIKAKTCWNANTLRGDYADLLILDEWQLMAEDTWDEVGAPMLMDNNGDAVFIYTPPSLRSSGVSRAKDPRHAAKMFKEAQADTTGRWETFHFTSYDNPTISHESLDEITHDMSKEAYRREILAEDDELQLSWLVYKAFNDTTCYIDPFPIPDNWPRYVGHDFGAANPAALFFAQDPATGYFYCYHEYLPGGGNSTATHVENFKEITKGTNVIKRVGGNQTTEDEIRQGYTAHGWPIQAPKFKSVKEQIDRVIALMELNKVFIFRMCHQWYDEITNCMWVLDDENRPTDKIKDEARYHLCACARYILSDFTPETVTPWKNRQTHYF